MRKSIVLKDGAMKCTDILEKGKETDRGKKEAWKITAKESYNTTSISDFDKLAEKANKGKYQWYKERPYMDSKTRNKDLHREIVKQALAEGKPVPPEVLADYYLEESKNGITWE